MPHTWHANVWLLTKELKFPDYRSEKPSMFKDLLG
jgi:hypothetical protein